MAKKKKLRQKRQQSLGDSSDENEDNKQLGKFCAHATRAVNLTAVKKVLKNIKLDECQQCVKEKKTVVSDAVDEDTCDVKTLSLCLQCGNIGCNEEKSGFHSKHHYLTPHSDCHALIVNTSTWSVWCHSCNDEIPLENYKVVSSAVNFIKKSDAAQSTLTPVVKPVLKNYFIISFQGLSNLGNTCFFNAVLQNLIQTPWLYEWLEEHCKNGYVWSITIPSTSQTNSTEKLDITLQECGELTQAFMSFLQKVCNSQDGVINPSQLFGQMCKKAPQFKGYQQQDSHELLCHLFDAMKNEEIRRQRNGILNYFFKTRGKIKNADDETKAKIKALSPVSCHTFVDVIFGGQLLSTVMCEECGMSSQRFEPFLNLSLPVAEEKPLRPGAQKRNASEKADFARETHCKQEEKKLSKHQETRMKRQAKKLAKKQMKAAKKTALTLDASSKDEPLITEEQNELDEEKSDQSEADVEDNIDVEPKDVSNRIDTKYKTVQNNQSVNNVNASEKNSSDSDNKDQDDIMISMEYFSSLTLEDCDQVENTEQNCTIESCNGENLCNEQISESKDSLFDVDQDRNRSPEETSSVSSVPDKDETQFGSPDSGISNSESERTSNHEQSSLATISSKTLAPRYHPASNECSVLSCLYQFTAPELLMGNNKFGCENCTRLKNRNKISDEKVTTVFSNASKQFLILSPPAVLILHLKRFQQVGTNLRKVNRHVEFPLTLDLAPFCSSDSQILPQLSKNQKEIPYSLYGVVEHSGRLTGGHYTAYVKTRHKAATKFASFLRHEPLNQSDIITLIKNFGNTTSENEPVLHTLEDYEEKWYYVSDGHVKLSSESQVLRSQGYLLFYERIV
ncbi:ubiquitin carboxyl-terminal hydrolase 45-like [Centruroides sculpturatus]|uniref:ubiquitin carboxyl-terminal hydrolase 45-like n=1 Tax=Centruroides sculpturatus TaxID=218467 RepID=UPI000C6D89EC|nr:ubiquitin carboxyl-terminal hydrolase 45-like [Centruroides sculpturatus]